MKKLHNSLRNDNTGFYRRQALTTARRFLAIMLMSVLLLGTGTGFSGICHGSVVDKEIRTAVIDSVSALLRELYVYPDIAEKMVELIRSRLENGEYYAIETFDAFIAELNKDVLSVFPDGHLNIDVMHELGSGQADNKDWWREYSENSRFNNAGFHKLDRLPGNVGYLELTEFDYPDLAGESEWPGQPAPVVAGLGMRGCGKHVQGSLYLSR